MKSGLCLSFADNFAKNLIQMLDDGTFGILYEVCIENKVEMDWKILVVLNFHEKYFDSQIYYKICIWFIFK